MKYKVGDIVEIKTAIDTYVGYMVAIEKDVIWISYIKLGIKPLYFNKSEIIRIEVIK